MASLPPLFDASKYLGPGFPEQPDFPTASDLLAHLDRLSVDRALVWHTEARGPRPMPGNEQLVREIAASGASQRLVPCLAIAPLLLEEQGALDRLVALATRHRTRAFRLWPKDAGWSLREIAPAVQRLLPLRPVLFLDVWQGATKEMLSLTAQFPQVPMVYTNPM